MPFAIQGELTGLDQLFKRMQDLDKRVRKKLTRQALKEGAKPVKEEAANLAEQGKDRTGLMGKAVGTKNVKKAQVALVLIGVREGFKREVTPPSGRTRTEDPANLAHLVEFGHGGPHPAPPYPFLRPAWDSKKSEAEQIIAAKLREGIANS